MAITSRRSFMLAAAAFPVGCAIDHRGASPEASRDVRQPAAGQSWRYAKHDLYSKAVMDSQVDRIAAIGRTIDIDSRTDATAAQSTAAPWGQKILNQFAGRAQPSADLPGEVQAPWGMVLVDPHWTQVQLFEAPIPLWPSRLQPGWHTRIKSTYTTPDGRAGLFWNQTMKAETWESVTVPAGRFTALRYVNLINFQDSDITRVDCMRRETVWFAPEVGRWIARESSGSFYVDDSVVDQPYNESGYRWELLEWT